MDDFAAGDETDAEKEASDDEEDEGQQFSVSVGDNKVAYKIPKVSQNKFSESTCTCKWDKNILKKSIDDIEKIYWR